MTAQRRRRQVLDLFSARIPHFAVREGKIPEIDRWKRSRRGDAAAKAAEDNDEDDDVDDVDDEHTTTRR
jgi:hypothetical protein